MVWRFTMTLAKLILGLRALEEGDLAPAAVDRQALEIAVDVVAADHVEDQVDALAAGLSLDHFDEVLGLIIDRNGRAQLSAFRAFIGGPGGCENARAEAAGELDGGGADAARSAMHQKVSPACRRPRSNTLVQTVKKVSGRAAASIIASLPGIGRHCGAGATQYSA
jgi:hypothetical protein